MTWDKFIDASPDAMPDSEIARDAPATLIYTSGSTAHPKGVLSSHRAIIHALMGWEGTTALATAGRPKRELVHPPAMILTVPLFHVTGLNAQFLLSFRAGRKLVGMYKWDVEKALAIIEQEHITLFNGVPTMAYELINSPKFDEYDLSSLRGIGGGGAAMSPQHSRQIDKKMKSKASPSAGYGMTETNGLGTTNAGRSLLAKPTSCGRAQALIVDIKIADDHGESLPPKQTGEIWIKGPMNFTGYWNNPDATAATLTDGWVHTGDIGHLDEEGYLFITDRAKDMVIRGGENIGCQEVEAVIYEHPKVGEVAVFGVPDARLGEAVAAVVTATTPHALTSADVKSHVAEHMARFKVPEHVWIRNEPLPRTASGKIFKRGLRDEAVALLKVRSSASA
jgi:long-chain acyl-CoA synthetase